MFLGKENSLNIFDYQRKLQMRNQQFKKKLIIKYPTIFVLTSIPYNIVHRNV